jgi:hypothetical protein
VPPKIWTYGSDFAGTSQWHIDIAPAPQRGTKFWNMVMGATACCSGGLLTCRIA